MELKLVGILLVIFASTAIGLGFGRDLQKHVRELERLRQTVAMIRGEIRYAGTPLTQVFEEVGRRSSEPYQSWFLKLSAALEARKGSDFSKLWAESIVHDLQNSTLTKTERLELKELGEQLGYLDRKMQDTAICFYMERLHERILRAREELREKRKLYAYLGVMSGVFLAVILA